MSSGGYAIGGVSGFGPSRMFDSLPWKGWRETATWLQEFVDACGLRFDNINARFISSAARSKLLDPTITPSDVPSQYLATSISSGTSAPSTDTMLDVLLFIALGLYPIDSNLTVAQRQALVQVGWSSLKRKGTRIQGLNIATKITDGVASSWSAALALGNYFSIIVPDGTPSPGQGVWSPPASTAATVRPWAFDAIRQCVIQPATVEYGVGYSQFRAGYSGAGEPVLPTGSRINILAGEHFDTWSAGVPVGWSKIGTSTLTQSASGSINYEFTTNSAVLDLTGAGLGAFVGLSQTAAAINNQLTHRLQLDYNYTNSQNVSVLVMQVIDANADGNTYYWNPTSRTWSTTSYSIPVPPSSSRGRFACDVVPQAQNGSLYGTQTVTVKVFATSDGTSTTKLQYTLYRVGLYESFSLAQETAAYGERVMWLPLKDAAGWATASRVSGATAVVPTNASRTQIKLVTGTAAEFPYHPALSACGYRAHTGWANLLKGSNTFTGADWTATNATTTANTQISPVAGEVSATAPTLSATSTGANLSQGTGLTPTNKVYAGGVWVKKLSTDGNFTDVTLSLVSTSTKSQAFTLTQAQGWQLLPFVFTFGGSDVAAMSMKLAWGAASSNGQISAYTAYLYDVTSNPKVLYPPVCVTPAGSTATLGATTCTPITQGANVLHPLTLRTMVSPTRDALTLTVVPTFDASSQPNGVIFDSAQGAAQNRVVLRVASGALELRRWDNGGNQWVATLTLTTKSAPPAGSMTWLRDTAIVMRATWDDVSTQLSAGASNAQGTKPGSWTPLDNNTAIGVGNDFAAANQFNGCVTLLEVDQSGSPS